jgi:hypothetical protein
MLYKYILLWCFLSVLFFNVQAQKKPIFNSITNIGALFGSADNSYSVQQIVGVEYKKIMLGAGVGLDAYSYRSLPVFIDTRYKLNNKKWQPFVYGQAGVNVAYSEKEVQEKFFNWNNTFPWVATNANPNNSFYGEIGVGVEKKLSKFLRLQISGGYSYKHLQYTAQSVNMLSSFMPPTIPTNEYNFYMRRWAIRFGFRFTKRT